MKPLLLCRICALVVVSLASAACNAENTANPNPVFEQVKADINAEIAAGHLTGVALALVHKGRIVWEEGFGLADREAGRKATSHTPFSIASTTKPITTTAIMLLAADGKIALDRPANDYLGGAAIRDAKGPAQAVTVRHLATHSSGLPTFFTMYPHGKGQPTVAALLRDYGHIIAPPGEHYEYSNLAMAALGEIVARQSGQDFGHYLETRVFAPLHMRDSFFGSNLKRAPEGAVRYDDKARALPYYVTGTPGSGEVYASAHDLATFAMLHLKNKPGPGKPILTSAQLDELHRPATAIAPEYSYGMGWQVWRHAGHPEALYHGGGQTGVTSEFVLVPGADAACIILSNRHTGGAVLEKARDRLLATVAPGWQGIPRTPAPKLESLQPLAAYVGSWRGTLLAQGRTVPVTLTISPDGKAGEFAIDGKPAQALTDLGISDGRLTATSKADIGSADTMAFKVDTVELDLKLRGDRMDGDAVAWKKTEDNMTVLPHWIALAREPSQR